MFEKREKHVGATLADEAAVPAGERDAEYWEREYGTFREEFDRDTELRAKPPWGERRAHPRLSFPPGSTVFVHDGPKEYPILNISVGGIAFRSTTRYAPGERIVLSAMGMLALDMEVLDCTIVETDATFMEYQYLVRARFGEQVNGYQAFVLAREIYQRLRQSARQESPKG